MHDLTAANRLDMGLGSRGRSHRRGLTLVEVLVALCILSIALVAISSIFPLALRYQERMLYKQIAAAYARSRLDNYSTLASAAGSDSVNPWAFIPIGTTTYSNSVSGLPTPNNVKYEISAYPPGSDGKFMKKIIVTVEWPGRGGNDYLAGNIIYETLVARPCRDTDGVRADI